MTARTCPPRTPRRSAALAAALVALCVLMSGIAPSVSRALAAARAPQLHDLCVAADAARPAVPVGHHGGEADDAACALCVVHGGTHAAPGRAAPAGDAPVAGRSGPRAERADASTRGRWIAATPRGPPATRHAA